jgi:hypothetical protein
MPRSKPRQPRLPFRLSNPRKSNSASFEAVNERAAEAILSDIERAGGAEALPVIWARSFVSRKDRNRA